MKLTKDQKEKLENLLPALDNSKLKKALKRAIKTWETEEYGKGLWGVIVQDGKVCMNPSYHQPACCLLGAAILNVKTKKDYEIRYPSVWAVTGFSMREVDIVVSTFDNGIKSAWIIYKSEELSSSEKELITEVLKIREILFDDERNELNW